MSIPTVGTETISWYDPKEHPPPAIEEFRHGNVTYHGVVIGFYNKYRRKKERSVTVWGVKGKITRWLIYSADGNMNIVPDVWRHLREGEK